MSQMESGLRGGGSMVDSYTAFQFGSDHTANGQQKADGTASLSTEGNCNVQGSNANAAASTFAPGQLTPGSFCGNSFGDNAVQQAMQRVRAMLGQQSVGPVPSSQDTAAYMPPFMPFTQGQPHAQMVQSNIGAFENPTTCQAPGTEGQQQAAHGSGQCRGVSGGAKATAPKPGARANGTCCGDSDIVQHAAVSLLRL